jgi:glutaredoxin
MIEFRHDDPHVCACVHSIRRQRLMSRHDVTLKMIVFTDREPFYQL